MSGTRRRFTAECRTEAAHRVIGTRRSVAAAAKQLKIGEANFYG